MSGRQLDTLATLPLGPLPPELVHSGTQSAGSRKLDSIGGLDVGIWEITPGVSRDVEAEEIFVVLSGSASVEFEDGELIELQRGVVVRLRSGERTVWRVTKTLRKIYFS